MKKIIALMTCLICLTAVFSGCGSSSYKDGTYEGKSETYINEDGDSDDGNGYGVVKITIKDNKITACEYKTYEEDGTLKDKNYGKKQGSVANADFYNKAQKALAAADEYAKKLVEVGSLDGVDAISGATINYDNFIEAVNNALDKAAE